jgi:hypothetical protein
MMIIFLRCSKGTSDGNDLVELEFSNLSNFSYSSPFNVPDEKLERGGGIGLVSCPKSGV